MGHIGNLKEEYPSVRIKRLADELREDISNIIEFGYTPTNQFNEHLMELKIVADIVSDSDL